MGAILYRHKDAKQAGVLFNSYTKGVGPDRKNGNQQLSSYAQLGLNFDSSYDPTVRVNGNYNIIYVSKDGDNTTGDSWESAFDSIETALGGKIAGQSLVIFVKEGVYSLSSLTAIVDTHIVGGFNGDNPTWQTRNGFSHPTVLVSDEEGFTLGSASVEYDGVVFRGTSLQLTGSCTNCVFDGTTPVSGAPMVYANRLRNSIFVNLDIEIAKTVPAINNRKFHIVYCEGQCGRVLVCNSNLKKAASYSADFTDFFFTSLESSIINNSNVEGISLAPSFYNGTIYKTIIRYSCSLNSTYVISSTLYNAEIKEQSIIKDSLINRLTAYNSYVYNCKVSMPVDVSNSLLVNVTGVPEGYLVYPITSSFGCTFVRCEGLDVVKKDSYNCIFMGCSMEYPRTTDDLPYSRVVELTDNYLIGFVDTSEISMIGYSAALVGLEEEAYGDYRLQSWSSLLRAGKSITTIQEDDRRKDVTGVNRTAFNPSIGCYELASSGEMIEKTYDVYKIDIYGSVVKLAEGLTPEKVEKIQQAQSKVAMLEDDFDPDDKYIAVSRRNANGGQLALGSLWQRKDSSSDMVKISEDEWDFISDKYAIKNGDLYLVNNDGTLESIASGVSQVTESGANGDAYALVGGCVYEVTSPETGNEMAKQAVYPGNIVKLCNTQGSEERIGAPLVIDTEGRLHYKEYGDTVKDKIVECLDGGDVIFVDAVGAGSVAADNDDRPAAESAANSTGEGSSIYDEDTGPVNIDEPIVAVDNEGYYYIGTLRGGIERIARNQLPDDLRGLAGVLLFKANPPVFESVPVSGPFELVLKPIPGVDLNEVLPPGVIWKDGKLIIEKQNPPLKFKLEDFMQYFTIGITTEYGFYENVPWRYVGIDPVTGGSTDPELEEGELKFFIVVSDKDGNYWKPSTKLEYEYKTKFNGPVTVYAEVNLYGVLEIEWGSYNDSKAIVELQKLIASTIRNITVVATDGEATERFENDYRGPLYKSLYVSWGLPGLPPYVAFRWGGCAKYDLPATDCLIEGTVRLDPLHNGKFPFHGPTVSPTSLGRTASANVDDFLSHFTYTITCDVDERAGVQPGVSVFSNKGDPSGIWCYVKRVYDVRTNKEPDFSNEWMTPTSVVIELMCYHWDTYQYSWTRHDLYIHIS